MRYKMKLHSFNGIWGHLEQELSKAKKKKRMPRIPHKRNIKLIREVTQAFLDSKNLSVVGFSVERIEHIYGYAIRFDPLIHIYLHDYDYDYGGNTVREETVTEFLQAQFKTLSIVRKLKAQERKRMQDAVSEYEEIIAAAELMS